MVRELVLHAGFHKTGSTSLQALLERNSSCLPEGTVYLGAAGGRLSAFARAIRAFEKAPGPECGRLLQREVAEVLALPDVAAAERVVISFEGMVGRIPNVGNDRPVYGHAAALLEWIVSDTDHRDTKVFLYTRSEDKWLRSLFRHLVVKRGIALTEDQFIAVPKFVGFSWVPILQDIRRVLADDLTVLRMEDDLGTRLGPGTQLLRHIGLTDEALEQWQLVPAQNRGASSEALRGLSHPVILALPRQLRRLVIMAKLKVDRLFRALSSGN